MITWVILIVLIVAVIVISKLVHFEHFQKKVFFILILFVLAFFCITILSVVKTNKIDLTSAQGILSLGKYYFHWLGHVLGNIGTLTGNAIRMDWSGNSTV
jgi:hypothetical protein